MECKKVFFIKVLYVLAFGVKNGMKLPLLTVELCVDFYKNPLMSLSENETLKQKETLTVASLCVSELFVNSIGFMTSYCEPLLLGPVCSNAL